MRLLLAIPTIVVAAYLAWAYGTEEGRTCGRIVRDELAYYRHQTSHASATER